MMMNNYLLYAVWNLAGVSLLALILSRELSKVAVLAISMIVPFLFYLESNSRLKKIQWLENFLVIFFFVFALLRFFYFKANFLLAVAEFLISFLLIKLAFKKERKDFMQIIVLSIFVFLSAATLATDFSFLFSFALFAISLCAALSFSALSEGKGFSEIGKKLLFQYLVQNAGITLALTVFFSISIFIFFPRLSLAVFQGTFLAPQRKSGFSDSVNLDGTGKIFQDTSVAMRVAIPQAGKKSVLTPLYLKGQTLIHFDGMRWTAGEKKSSWLVADPFRSRILKAQKVIRNRFPVLGEETKSNLKKKFSMALGAESYLTQKIYLESLEGAHLFAVPWAEEIFEKVPQLSVAEDFTIQRQENFSGRTVYEVRSILERPDEKILLRQQQVGSGEELQKYLQIPAMDFSRTNELLAKLVSKKDPPFIQAKKIEKFLREEFQYSLQNPIEKSSNPAEEFLFETKRGHCEYFASAMALLLRLAGIPSRLVTGFLAQEWNPEGAYFVVRGKDAHAWVEAYVADRLWLEFDPSPRLPGEDLEQAGFWTLFKRKVDYLNFLWNSYILSYDMESQKQLARNMELKSVRFSRELDNFFAKGRRWLLKQLWHSWKNKLPSLPDDSRRTFSTDAELPLGLKPSVTSDSQALKHWLPVGGYLILLFLSLWIVIKLNYYFKNKREGKPEAEFYSQMLVLLDKKGLKRLAAETPWEFAKRVVRELALPKGGEPIHHGKVENAIGSLTLLFCKIRYSDYTPTPSDLAEATHSLSYLKHSL